LISLKSKEPIVYKKFVELAAQELEKKNAELTIKGIDLSRLREQEAQLTEQQTDLKYKSNRTMLVTKLRV
jgi:hypothetical protein